MALALIRRVWLFPNLQKGLETTEEELRGVNLQNREDLRRPVDMARITLALARANPGMERQEEPVSPFLAETPPGPVAGVPTPQPLDKSKSKPTPEQLRAAETAETVFLATALWDPASWEEARDRLNTYAPPEARDLWSKKFNMMGGILRRAVAENENPQLASEIGKLKKTPGWEEKAASEKILKVAELLGTPAGE